MSRTFRKDTEDEENDRIEEQEQRESRKNDRRRRDISRESERDKWNPSPIHRDDGKRNRW